MLRAATLPGAELALSLLRLPGCALADDGRRCACCGCCDTGLGTDAADLARVVDALPDATARAAFIRTLRAVVDWRGQVVTMLDRCYLTRGMPTLLIWGGRDSVVPVAHAHRAHAAMPGSRLRSSTAPGTSPSTPTRAFHRGARGLPPSTQPADWSSEQWRALLRGGRAALVPDDGYGPPGPDYLGAELQAVSERSAT